MQKESQELAIFLKDNGSGAWISGTYRWLNGPSGFNRCNQYALRVPRFTCKFKIQALFLCPKFDLQLPL